MQVKADYFGGSYTINMDLPLLPLHALWVSTCKGRSQAEALTCSHGSCTHDLNVEGCDDWKQALMLWDSGGKYLRTIYLFICSLIWGE